MFHVDLYPFKEYIEVSVLPQNPERRLYLGIVFCTESQDVFV